MPGSMLINMGGVRTTRINCAKILVIIKIDLLQMEDYHHEHEQQ